MSKQKKKEIRNIFRNKVFERDHFQCRICLKKNCSLDAHHIKDRSEIINGGYVLENGITLCPDCHEKAEEFHRTGWASPGWFPEDLYKLIGSSLEKAIRASEKLETFF